MIKIDGDDFYRDGSKVGYISGKTIHDRGGSELGYYGEDCIYNPNTEKIAYLEGDHLCVVGENRNISFDYIHKNVVGGDLPELAKCAIYLLIGI